jgi:hypothetical protein
MTISIAKDYAYPAALVTAVLSSVRLYISSGRLIWCYTENNVQ